MTRVAILGACGYVGTMLYDFLKDKYEIDCFDIADSDIYPPHQQKSSTDFTKEEVEKYDVFLYVAGLSRKEDCEKSNETFVFKKNVVETLHIPRLMNANQVFLYSSTGSLYSSKGNDRLCEESDEIDTEDFQQYEKSMYEREHELQKLGKKCIGLRFGTVIGLSKNMRAELLHNALFNSAMTSKKLTLWNPRSKRAILWYQDLTACFDILIKQRDSLRVNEVFNLVSFNTTIEEAARSLCAISGATYEIIKDIHSLGFYMSNDLFTKRFGYCFKGSNESIFQVFSERKDEFLNLIQNPVGKYKKCIICKSIRLQPILNLGNQPLANNFLSEQKSSPQYPLHLHRCLNCFHTQIDYIVDRGVLFTNYLYESGTSATLREYFASLAERYTQIFKDKQTKRVLELACNDCFQLDEFKSRGWLTYGVDPAQNLVKRGLENGHIVEAKFWGKEEVSFLKDTSFDLIVAQNVLAHVNNPVEFLQKCASIMNPDTLLVIQTSQCNMYFNNEFDTIYHEHISFFTIRSMMRAVESVGCHLENVYKTDIHGTSYVFEIKKGLGHKPLALMDDETNKGLYTDALYNQYTQNISTIKNDALVTLQNYKDKGYKILGFGAAAKGMVFLNYLFDSQHHPLAPEVLIDNSKIKQGRFTDGTLIPIYDIDVLSTYTNQKVVILILAWNFFPEIARRIQLFIQEKNLSIEGETICFFPNYKVSPLNA